MWYQSRGYVPLVAADGRLLADDDREYYRVRRGVRFPSRAHGDFAEDNVRPRPRRQPVAGVFPPEPLFEGSSEGRRRLQSWTTQPRIERRRRDRPEDHHHCCPSNSFTGPQSCSLPSLDSDPESPPKACHTKNPHSCEQLYTTKIPFHHPRPPDLQHYGLSIVDFGQSSHEQVTSVVDLGYPSIEPRPHKRGERRSTHECRELATKVCNPARRRSSHSSDELRHSNGDFTSPNTDSAVFLADLQHPNRKMLQVAPKVRCSTRDLCDPQPDLQIRRHSSPDSGELRSSNGDLHRFTFELQNPDPVIVDFKRSLSEQGETHRESIRESRGTQFLRAAPLRYPLRQPTASLHSDTYRVAPEDRGVIYPRCCSADGSIPMVDHVSSNQMFSNLHNSVHIEASDHWPSTIAKDDQRHQPSSQRHSYKFDVLPEDIDDGFIENSRYDTCTHQRMNSVRACHIREIPCFDGNVSNLWDWISLVDEYFEYVEVESSNQAKIVARKFRSYVVYWWERIQNQRVLRGKDKIRTWRRMRKEIINEFVPACFVHNECSYHAQSLEQRYPKLNTMKGVQNDHLSGWEEQGSNVAGNLGSNQKIDDVKEEQDTKHLSEEIEIISGIETHVIVCGDINVTNEDEGTYKNEVLSLGFTDFNLAAGDLAKTNCDGTIEKEGFEDDKEMKKFDFLDLIVDDLLESLLPFPRALDVAFEDTSEAKDGFDILDSNLGYKLIYYNDAFHVKIHLQTTMENGLGMDSETFLFAFAKLNSWKCKELMVNMPVEAS